MVPGKKKGAGAKCCGQKGLCSWALRVKLEVQGGGGVGRSRLERRSACEKQRGRIGHRESLCQP